MDSFIKVNTLIDLIEYEINDISYSSGIDDIYKIEDINHIKDFISNIKPLLFFCNQRIQSDYCYHNMEKDYIDLTPDKSQMIHYCTKCGFTKHC
jgi:hypothetical protein